MFVSVMRSAYVCLAVLTVTWAKPSCPVGKYQTLFINDPTDCSAFYLCVGSSRFDYSCGKLVWNQEIKTCVLKGSDLDMCTTPSTSLCNNDATRLVVKNDNCAEYYNCSAPNVNKAYSCKYPFLFNPETERCEHYSMVTCGERWEPVSPCEYSGNWCQSPHCTPCSVSNPSCRGLPDGPNTWVGREDSPYYVICKDQRNVYGGICANARENMFDPVLRSCVCR